MEHKAYNMEHARPNDRSRPGGRGTRNIKQGEKLEPPSSFTRSMLRAPCSRGFSLTELIVSIAIFLLITSIVMVSQYRFGSKILITNLAYDVALGIRQAQVYGSSSRKAAGALLGNEFNRKYGVHFGPTDYFILFVDLNDDGVYDSSDNTSTGCVSSSECVSFFKVERGNSISDFCGGSTCKSGGAISGLDIFSAQLRREMN